jgi:beta-phosphoglucomutase-like phosphatase (HAD superfamily)
MGASPEACVVVEDSLLGIEAAHRAGMRALLYDPCASIELPRGPRVVAFGSMNELPALIAEPSPRVSS